MNIAIGASPVCYARGGTERVAVGLANAMLARGHGVHLFAFDHGSPPVFPLDPRIRLILLPPAFASGSHAEISRVRAYLTQHDIDVFLSLQSEWTHMLWALCCLGTGTPFICSERSDPRFSERVTWNRPGRMSVLASADAIHELVEAHVETVPPLFRPKVRVIPNAAPVTGVRADTAREDGVILFLARFIPGKRADMLLRAFALVRPQFPRWRLRLAGYGPEEDALKSLAAELGLSGSADFVHSPPSWEEECARAQIYCLPTRVEGFPNSVLEAMACGLPVVGLADCPAMNGIVKNGVNGLLVPEASPAALADSLAALMGSAALRERLGKAALEECATLYRADGIWNQWEEFLGQVAQKRHATLMDSFSREPLASRFTLASAVRREYLYRNFGEPMPWSWPWWKRRSRNIVRNGARVVAGAARSWAGRNTARLAALREAVRMARNVREVPYLYRQIEKTRRVGPGRSERRSRTFAAWLATQISLEDKRILCVGCGDSRELRFWASLGAHATGIDLHGGGEVLPMNMEQLDFADDSFDMVYACHSFEHAKDQKAAAREFLRVVRPGGHIAIEVPTNPLPGKVDLHPCLKKGDLANFFSEQGTVVFEGFLSSHEDANGAEEDICRLIFQKA